jgi:hypothetical protein
MIIDIAKLLRMILVHFYNFLVGREEMYEVNIGKEVRVDGALNGFEKAIVEWSKPPVLHLLRADINSEDMVRTICERNRCRLPWSTWR